MGIFRQFPYTNFHDLNLDWFLNEFQELVNEWFSFKGNIESWKDDTDKAINDLKEYVNEFFKFEVDAYIDKLYQEGFFDQAIARVVLNRTKINTRMVMSIFNSYANNTPAAVNGACYIGDNKIIQYLSTNTSTVGKAQIISTDTWQVLAEVPLELKHGNSLTYDPETHKAYGVALYNNDNVDILLNEVMVINMDNPLEPFVEETIALPMPAGSTGVYSLSYDPVSKTFAGTIKSSPTGSIVAGETDRLVIYNQDLDEIVKEVSLTDHLLIRNQGIQAFYDNKAYINYCDYNYFTIGVYDTETGIPVSMVELPRFIDGYRFIGEPEAFIYNWDSDSWYCSSAYTGGGVSSKIGLTIFELGLYKNIPNIEFRTQAFNLFNTQRLEIQLKNGQNGVTDTPYEMYSLMDAINMCVNNNLQGRIRVNSGYTNIGSVDIVGYSGDIYGNNSNHAIFSGAIRIFNSKVRITFSDFTGSQTEDNRECSLFIDNSYGSFEGCAFTNKQLLAYDSWINWRNNTGNSTYIRSLLQSQTQPADSNLIQSAFLAYA